MEILTVLALCVGAAAPSGEGVRVEAALGKRRLEATRLVGPAPVIDGRVEDPAWATAATTTDLIQRRPHPGSLASLPTQVRVLYDERSLFIGLRLHDPEPDSITAPYPRRDDEITSDWVFVEIDSRHDRRTAFSFGVNPRGVQVDGVFFNDTTRRDGGVWESAARITADGWEAEFRIPFSQLVYTPGEADEQGAPVVWGLNVYRYNPSRGETSNWSPRLPSLAGIVSNFNELRLRVPARTSRLELMPYAPPSGGTKRASRAAGTCARASGARSRSTCPSIRTSGRWRRTPPRSTSPRSRRSSPSVGRCSWRTPASSRST
jgi:hypothetical protein